MKHRSDYRTVAEESVAHTFLQGMDSEEVFDPPERLAALSSRPIPEKINEDAPRVLHISMYCYKSFPIRIFHVLSLKDGIDSHAVFFKNNFTNDHLPVSDRELDLLVDLVRDIDPHLITFSVLAPYVVATRRAIERIRRVSNAMIMLGGKYPTIAPHEALEFADYACKGDGDLIILRIHERLRNGEDLRGIRGLWYKDEKILFEVCHDKFNPVSSFMNLKNKDADQFWFTIIRHPITTLHSFFNYMKLTINTGFSHETVNDFIDDILDGDLGKDFKIPPRRPGDFTHLSEFDFVGIKEEMEKTCKILSKILDVKICHTKMRNPTFLGTDRNDFSVSPTLNKKYDSSYRKAELEDFFKKEINQYNLYKKKLNEVKL